ncbi:MAG: GyrI-like domain-containing protein [Alphaproteobacteria bacterium]
MSENGCGQGCTCQTDIEDFAQGYQVKAGLETVPAFDVVGLSGIVSGHKNASEGINALWQEFFERRIGAEISDRLDDVIYAVYSDYEGDYTKPYRLTIGYKVPAGVLLDNLAAPLSHIKVEEGSYALMSAQGAQPQALIDIWTTVWQSDLDRSYKTDFEIYGARFFEDGVHEVLVAIGVNQGAY